MRNVLSGAALLSLATPILGLTCQTQSPGFYKDIQNPMATGDIQSIIDSFNDGSFTILAGNPGNSFDVVNKRIHIEHTASVSIYYQTVQVCIQRPNLFESTFVDFSSIATAVSTFLSTCCTDPSGICKGGSTDTNGVNIFVQFAKDSIEQCQAGGQTLTHAVGTAKQDPQTTAEIFGAIGGSLSALAAVELWVWKFGGLGPLASFWTMAVQGVSVNPVSAVGPLQIMVETEVVDDAETDAQVALRSLLNFWQAEGGLAAGEVAQLESVLTAIATGAAETIGELGDD